MQAVLAIDVGLINLAVCCMDINHTILAWEVVNVLSPGSQKGRCQHLLKSGGHCKYTGKYVAADGTFRCGRHAAANSLAAPTRPLVRECTIQDLTVSLLTALDALHMRYTTAFAAVSDVVIELQPRVNPKMKFASHIIYGKCVDMFRERAPRVRFTAAKHKLRGFRGPADMVECCPGGRAGYSQRKHLAVRYTEWYLEHGGCDTNGTWREVLSAHSGKADDLCDCFLMAYAACRPAFKTDIKDHVQLVPDGTGRTHDGTTSQCSGYHGVGPVDQPQARESHTIGSELSDQKTKEAHTSTQCDWRARAHE